MSEDGPSPKIITFKPEELYFGRYSGGIGVLRRNSKGKKYLVLTHHYDRTSKRDREFKEIEAFSNDQDLPQTMKYVSLSDDIVSSEFAFKGDTHPRDVGLNKIDALGSGVHGTFRDAPDTIDIKLRKLFYIKGPLAREFLEQLTKKTNELLIDVVENEGRLTSISEHKIEKLAVGWNIFLMSGYDGDEYEFVEIKDLVEWVEWWYSSFFSNDSNRNKLKIPPDFIPAFINVVMFKRNYKSIASYCNCAVIYPPYSKGSTIIFDHI